MTETPRRQAADAISPQRRRLLLKLLGVSTAAYAAPAVLNLGSAARAEDRDSDDRRRDGERTRTARRDYRSDDSDDSDDTDD